MKVEVALWVWGRLEVYAAVSCRQSPDDGREVWPINNRPQVNNLPHIAASRKRRAISLGSLRTARGRPITNRPAQRVPLPTCPTKKSSQLAKKQMNCSTKASRRPPFSARTPHQTTAALSEAWQTYNRSLCDD